MAVPWGLLASYIGLSGPGVVAHGRWRWDGQRLGHFDDWYQMGTKRGKIPVGRVALQLQRLQRQS